MLLRALLQTATSIWLAVRTVPTFHTLSFETVRSIKAGYTSEFSRQVNYSVVLTCRCILVLKYIIYSHFIFTSICGDRGRVAQWLRCCATIWKVARSIPAGVSGFFVDIKSFRSHYGPGVDSASNRNEYQEYFLRVKAAGA